MRILFGMFIAMCASMIAMKNDNNNQLMSDEEHCLLISRVVHIIPSLQQNIANQSNNEIFFKENTLWIFPVTEIKIPYNCIFSENQQQLSTQDGQFRQKSLTHIYDKKTQVIHSFKKKELCSKLQNHLNSIMTLSYWKCDGPNANNIKVVVCTDKNMNLEERMFGRVWTTSYTNFIYKVINGKLEEEQVLQSCYKYRQYPITALALAYKRDRCILATDKDDGQYVSIFDLDQNTIEPIFSFKVYEEKDLIKRLQFLTATQIYAFTDKGNVYAIDLKAERPKGIKQIFKDKDSKEIQLQDFAIDAKNPKHGALLSNDTLYLVNIPTQKFKVISPFGVPFKAYKDYVGPRHIKMVNGKIGIFHYHEDDISIQILDIAKIYCLSHLNKKSNLQ